MKTVFVGGSRAIAALPPGFQDRLGNIMAGGLGVLVGDAPGADRAVQEFFAQAGYLPVTVFCAGAKPRHNLGGWPARAVPSGAAAGFQFHAAKDRAMASEADFGLMIWDGASPGTILNVFRMVRHAKPAVLADAVNAARTFKTMRQWNEFFAALPRPIRRAAEDRMIPSERETVGASDEADARFGPAYG